MALIKKAFQLVSRNYLNHKQQPIEGDPIAVHIRTVLPQVFIEAASIDESKYRVYASAGQGGWAEIPWLAILDREVTTSTQTGIYICYLFSADMAKVYLSLAIGWTQYEKEYGVNHGQEKILQDAHSLRGLIKSDVDSFNTEPIDLRSARTLGKGYELGTILNKAYDTNSFPEDLVLIDDFRNLLGVYNEVKRFDLKSLPATDMKINDIGQEVAVKSANVYDWATAQKEINKLDAKYQNEPVIERMKLARTLVRNPKFARLVKQAAGFKCQICGTEAFEQQNKEPYAEAHHLDELAISRIDNPARMICVCPTCHKVLHYGSDSALEKRKHNL